MSIEEVLADLKKQGVEFWTEGDRLRFRAPNGVLNPETRSFLSANKELIITSLHEDASRTIRSLPLSWNQRGLWLTHQLAPQSAAYNVAFASRIRSQVNVPALREAFQAIVDRHATLRTRYALEDAQLVQQVYGYSEVSFEQVPVDDMTDAELDHEVHAAYQLPFDLVNGPVMRVHLFTRSPNDHILLLNVHHIALDGWSMWIVLDELGKWYSANVSGEAAKLTRPEVEYADFIEWQSDLLNGDRGQELWDYWREALAGELPTLDLPIRLRSPANVKLSG